MNSLRARLFVTLTLVLAATGLAAGVLAFRFVFDEAIELQDSTLIQIAAVAATAPLAHGEPALDQIDADTRVAIEELGKERADAKDIPPLVTLADGLHTIARDHQAWRFLVRTRADGSRFAVGQPTAARDEIASGSALRTVLPLLAVIPFLMLVVGLVIRQTFRPMARVAMRLDARRPEQVEGLPLDGMPNELHPFIASINRLLERIRLMIDQQRRFVADAAHELRSPIAALSVQSENLRRADLPQASRERVAALQDGIRRTAHLLEQLLALARYDTMDDLAVPVSSLDQCAKEAVSDLLGAARARALDLGFTQIESVSVRAEPVMLAVMIGNLIDNAIRPTPAGGRVDVGICREGDHVTLLVEDTGPGIPQTDLARIFEPFFRGSQPADDGTGLGLSIVKRIAERLGGSVFLENVVSPDRSGLRASVKIPAVDNVAGLKLSRSR
jgi:two-component system, OmpR family, sensor kinase